MWEDNLIDPDCTPQSVVSFCLCIALLRIASEIELHQMLSSKQRDYTTALLGAIAIRSSKPTLRARALNSERSTSRRPLHSPHPFDLTAQLPTRVVVLLRIKPARVFATVLNCGRSTRRMACTPAARVIVLPYFFPLRSCELYFHS